MGIGFRVFFVEEDGTVRRFPFSRFDRLIRREPQERLPEYAGKQKRYAFMILELKDKRPHRILHCDYSLLSFDSQGKLDSDVHEEQTRIAIEVIPDIVNHGRTAAVVDARHHFARKRYESEFKWKPNREIESRICDVVFNG
jgi:hypothetical protein